MKGWSMFGFNKLFVSFLAAFLLWGSSSQSFAGYRDDRLVVWVNLDESPGRELINKMVKDFVESGRVDAECGVSWHEWGSVLYMKKRPPGITDELIRKVFIEKDRKSLQYLNRFLKSFRDADREIDEGLDGVIVYSKKNGPKMMNFVTGRKKIKTFEMRPGDASPSARDIEDAFCVLLPPVTRAP
ncbi:hypothetical protein [Variovorax sp. 350MFTsu5.1]|uniref:hypothetical protein n=1 Tax=Variovorax sp. 350MFTsu5.1 TaxID=3158365 RepID=UPI003AAF76BA